MNLELLKEERIKKGFSQSSMAKALGFKSRSSYFFIENGVTSVTVDLAKKISVVLDLSTEKFLEIFYEEIVQERSTETANIS